VTVSCRYLLSLAGIVAVAGSELKFALGNDMKPGMIPAPVCPDGVYGKRHWKPSRVVSTELRFKLAAV
jgi:hypothetical protein